MYFRDIETNPLKAEQHAEVERNRANRRMAEVAAKKKLKKASKTAR